MFKSKFIALAVAIGAVSSIPLVHAGTVAGFGGSTEITQLMNNAELLKMGVDGAQTAVTTVNQYMVQIEQYRNQLINTAGMDPMKLNAQVTSSIPRTSSWPAIVTKSTVHQAA